MITEENYPFLAQMAGRAPVKALDERGIDYIKTDVAYQCFLSDYFGASPPLLSQQALLSGQAKRYVESQRQPDNIDLWLSLHQVCTGKGNFQWEDMGTFIQYAYLILDEEDTARFIRRARLPVGPITEQNCRIVLVAGCMDGYLIGFEYGFLVDNEPMKTVVETGYYGFASARPTQLLSFLLVFLLCEQKNQFTKKMLPAGHEGNQTDGLIIAISL